jgi:hypothetical protein
LTDPDVLEESKYVQMERNEVHVRVIEIHGIFETKRVMWRSALNIYHFSSTPLAAVELLFRLSQRMQHCCILFAGQLARI